MRRGFAAPVQGDDRPYHIHCSGVPSEVVLEEGDGMKQTCAVNLYNVATVARERLGRRVAQLSDNRMREVCSALRFALGCDQ